jgi:hypothetical protein
MRWTVWAKVCAQIQKTDPLPPVARGVRCHCAGSAAAAVRQVPQIRTSPAGNFARISSFPPIASMTLRNVLTKMSELSILDTPA